MARPRDVERSRDLALRAAVVLEREGVTLPAEQLARALGVKRPTLLYHFPTYASIVEVALAELLAEQALFVAERVERHEHPVDRLFARVSSILEFHRGKESRILFLTQAIAVTGGARTLAILQGAAAVFDEARRDMVARVERGIASGVVRPCDARALVSLVRAVIDGLTVQRVTATEPIEPVLTLFWEEVLAPLKIEPPRGAPSRPARPRARRPARR
ncbi:MAG: TetR/AcrR family transcriptional regulator [Myxococcales bacterium]|nr:TetR/AcrR family transcriptional regulator [Myxococcales bacterium]